MESTSGGMKVLLPLGTETKYGTHNYVQYDVGGINSKIVISATHGGNLRPESIPSRTINPERKMMDPSTNICINADIYTKEMADMLRSEIRKMTTVEETPHLIMCKCTCILSVDDGTIFNLFGIYPLGHVY